MSRTIAVDVHCHSSSSDGDSSPEQVAEEMARANVCWAALTDHDTVNGQRRFRAALEKRKIGFISGAEVMVSTPWGPAHLLAYGFDLDNIPFLRLLKSLRHPVRSYLLHFLGRVRGLPGRLRGRSASQVLELCPGLRTDGFLSVVEAIHHIHNAGGLAFLAHPVSGENGLDNAENLIGFMCAEGLDGVEVFYKPYPEETRRTLLRIAENRHLLMSAGSDFHGAHSIEGCNSPGVTVPEIIWDDFLSAVRDRPRDPSFLSTTRSAP
jgi:predicted metal-dependent phosphoesterase TrpH